MNRFSYLLSVVLLCGLGLSFQAFAITEAGMMQSERPALYMRGEDNATILRALQMDTQVQMDIAGMISRVVVRQEFRNNTSSWQEGIYVFPLPDNAAVDHMRLWIGERFIEGDIQEKQLAEEIYQQAKSQGKQAALVRQERNNIFTTSVSNIAPNDSIVVEIEYQQEVRYEQNRFSLRFPTVVAPRYIPGHKLTGEIKGFSGSGWADNTDQVPDASRITPPVIDERDSAGPLFSLKINLDAGMPLALIDSPYQPIEINELSTGKYQIILQHVQAPANRDFELYWQSHPGQEPQAAWFAEHRQDTAAGYYGLLMLMPPAADQLAVDLPRELILLVDTSGSMHGASMEQAKAAVKLAINRLQQGDHFNVIQFDHTPRRLFDQAVPVTSEHIAMALKYVTDMQADGGTEMMSALQMALDGELASGMLRQVVFITDGAVGDEQALFQLIRQQLGSSRLFTVGIGSAPNSHFMTRAAEAGRGSFTYIGQVDEVQEKMQRLFSKLESPALTDISLDWGQQVQQWPSKVGDLYAGEPVLVSVRSDQPLSELQLGGTLGEQSWSRQLQLQGGKSAPGIHVLWARNQIRELMNNPDLEMTEEVQRKQVVELAIEHHLVSPHTSLVAVDKTPVRPADAVLESSPVPIHLPAGWSAEKVFGILPQTATSAELQFIIGLLSLLLAGLIWGLGGRRVSGET